MKKLYLVYWWESAQVALIYENHDTDVLFWSIDEIGDPYSCIFRPMDRMVLDIIDLNHDLEYGCRSDDDDDGDAYQAIESGSTPSDEQLLSWFQVRPTGFESLSEEFMEQAIAQDKGWLAFKGGRAASSKVVLKKHPEDRLSNDIVQAKYTPCSAKLRETLVKKLRSRFEVLRTEHKRPAHHKSTHLKMPNRDRGDSITIMDWSCVEEDGQEKLELELDGGRKLLISVKDGKLNAITTEPKDCP